MDQCWTSPAVRARETAAALGLSPTVDERLKDCDFGRWAGLRFNQLIVREPLAFVAWVRNPSQAPHGGETIPQVMARVADWIDERGRSKGGGHMVAITHASVIRAAILHVIQAQLPSFWRIDVLPLSRTELRTNGRRWVFRAMGEISPHDHDHT